MTAKLKALLNQPMHFSSTTEMSTKLPTIGHRKLYPN